MPAEKTPPPKRKSSAGPAWQIVFEDIHSQNQATIEAVEASRAALEERIDRLSTSTEDRFCVLEGVVRDLHRDVRDLKGDVRGLKGDVRSLTVKVDALTHLEERVSTLEKRRAG